MTTDSTACDDASNVNVHVRAVDDATDALRRSPPAAIGYAAMVAAFVFLPMFPGTERVLGAFDSSHAAWIAGPLLMCIVLSTIAYHTVGSRHGSYRVLEALELCCCTAFAAAFPLIEPETADVAATFLLITAAFWAQGKPGHARRYAALSVAVVLVFVMVFVGKCQYGLALFEVAMAIACALTFRTCAGIRIASIRAEVRRNALRAETRALRVNRERGRIERELSAHLFSPLDQLAAELEREGYAEAATAKRLSEMASELVFPKTQPVWIEELVELVESRCRLLCRGARLRVETRTIEGATLGVTASVARAALRIAQELVRNAVVHGLAKTVRVRLEVQQAHLEVSVADDGKGIEADAVERSSGGIANVRSWVLASHGRFVLEPSNEFSTCLVATLSLAPDADGSARVDG